MTLSPPQRLAFVLLSIGLIVGLAACGTADPRFIEDNVTGAGPSGEILFVADGDVQLWADGEIRQITSDIDAASPRWSPAGERFAYVQVYRDLGYSDLMIADRDGDPLKQVTQNRPDAEPYSESFVRYAYWAIDPAWSPAGEQLAWVSDLGGWEAPPGVARFTDPLYLWYSETWEAPPYLLPAAEDVPVDLRGFAASQESPTFSPDGNQLAFVVDLDPTEIWTVDLNSAELTPLVERDDAAYDPAWSPDGAQIAFVQRHGTQNDIWIAPLDGDEPYALTTTGDVVSPTWSPDGQYLAYFRANGGGFSAWVVELDEDTSGHLSASEPQKLFTANDIDAPSGMSWAPAS